jgi:hypothetical protein
MVRAAVSEAPGSCAQGHRVSRMCVPARGLDSSVTPVACARALDRSTPVVSPLSVLPQLGRVVPAHGRTSMSCAGCEPSAARVPSSVSSRDREVSVSRAPAHIIRRVECPTVRYAVTRDGRRIAFHVTGAGVPLLMLFPYHVNHLRLNWRVPLHRGAIGFLARHFTVVNLDFRGAGCSGPGIAELSLTALAEDVDAVLRELGIDRVALCAMGSASLIGCAYAAAAARAPAAGRAGGRCDGGPPENGVRPRHGRRRSRGFPDAR